MKINNLLVALTGLVGLIPALVIAKCPHDELNLEKWSDVGTWGGTTPGANANVTITKPILFNTNTTIFSITIKKGGKLVWSPNGNFELTLHYILIQDGGEMHIGSDLDVCKFDRKAKVTLLGEPGELSVPGFGEKFIGVEKGGTLELHGKDKLSWTKLTKSTTKEILFYSRNRVENNAISCAHFSPGGGIKNFGFFQVSQTGEVKEEGDCMKIMKDILDGDVLALSVTIKFIQDGDHSEFYNNVESVAGPTRIREIWSSSGVAYSLVAVKGPSSPKKVEQLTAVTSLNAKHWADFKLPNTRFLVQTNCHKTAGMSFSQFLNLNTAPNQDIIEVVDDISSWKVGDKIVVTSTDYWWKQAEEKTIVSCPTCSYKQIKVDTKFKFGHYGNIYKNVDMRAEVALLTRNILIEGKVNEGQSNGGHIKFQHGFRSVRVEGVELTKMGQPLILGRYPLHYHMCLDLANTTVYPMRSYLRKNSIHHTNFRCITIHGTHNATIMNNVCYDAFGHGYFMEDGGEQGTWYEGNIGLGQKGWKGKVENGVTGALPTDRRPATFWVTNPRTTMRNNVAAGGEGMGMWYVYPERPVGPSRSLNMMQTDEARHTPITEFTNNVIHSYGVTGLQVDNRMFDDLTVKEYNLYDPRENPLDLRSKAVPAVFNRLTAYKNRVFNMWMRGAFMVVENSSFSDSETSVAILKEKRESRFLKNSVIIGESDNLGWPDRVGINNRQQYIQWHRSIPLPNSLGRRRGGIQVKATGEYIDNVFFDGFNGSRYYKSAALAPAMCHKADFNTGVRFMTKNLRFGFVDSENTGRRLYEGEDAKTGDCKTDDNMLPVLTDTDGSLIGKNEQNNQLITPLDFTMNGQCTLRKNWNMTFCKHKYGHLKLIVREPGFDLTANRMITTRADDPFYNTEITRPPVILGGSVEYLVNFKYRMPNHFRIEARGVSRTETVRVAVCIPRGADIEVQFKMGWVPRSSKKVCDLRMVDTDTTGGNYHIDETVGVVFFKFIHEKEYALNEGATCPGGSCAAYKIKIKTGGLNDSDCVNRFKAVHEYVNPSTGNPVVDASSVISDDGTNPPTTWGAGVTYPF